MNERSEKIFNLQNNEESRVAYIKATLNTLIPSQIRALRLKSKHLSRQSDLAHAAGMKQSRISAMETPGAVNFNLETLVRLAAVLKVGLIVKFASFTDMLRWDNNYSQDEFSVVTLDEDSEFLSPSAEAFCSGSEAASTLIEALAPAADAPEFNWCNPADVTDTNIGRLLPLRPKRKTLLTVECATTEASPVLIQ